MSAAQQSPVSEPGPLWVFADRQQDTTQPPVAPAEWTELLGSCLLRPIIIVGLFSDPSPPFQWPLQGMDSRPAPVIQVGSPQFPTSKHTGDRPSRLPRWVILFLHPGVSLPLLATFGCLCPADSLPEPLSLPFKSGFSEAPRLALATSFCLSRDRECERDNALLISRKNDF